MMFPKLVQSQGSAFRGGSLANLPGPSASRQAQRRPVVAVASASAGAPFVPDPSVLQSADVLYAAIANLEHDQLGHPEQGARVPAILDTLEAFSLRGGEQGPGDQRMVELTDLRSATADEISLVHLPGYPKELPKICSGKAPGTLEAGGPTYFTSGSSDAAFRSAGAGMQLVDAVVASAEARRGDGKGGAAGFGICRPPGHHAIPAGPMGFCIFNNISVMARYAQEVHGLKKVLIFDFDVHHGNGTHDAFYRDPSVLFVSTHQAGGYPGTGLAWETGEDDGEGYTINLPLPGDSGDYAMMAAFEEVVAPAARRFQPDIILVSAGYDAHWRDPLAGLQLRTSTYHTLTGALKRLANELCEGRVVFMLEGGYDLKALGESVSNSFLALLGQDARDAFNPALLRDEPLENIQKALAECKATHELR